MAHPFEILTRRDFGRVAWFCRTLNGRSLSTRAEPKTFYSIIYAIHWYVEANLSAGAAEGSIVLIQTALELIGSVFLAEDTATARLKATEYDEKKAEEKIRTLLADMRIPLTIPAKLTALANAATRLGLTTGPEIFVEIRHAIVHSKPQHRLKLAGITADERGQACELGLWYLELALLYVFEYHGPYHQRTATGFPGEINAQMP